MSEAADPYHSGEKRIQALAGEQVAAERNGRGIGDRVPEGGAGWLGRQRLAVVATVDPEGFPRASVQAGEPGFLGVSASGREVRIASPFCGHNPLADVRLDPRAGLLVLDPMTRRRYRVNGTASAEEGTLVLGVEEAFGNCPQYIQRRRPPAERWPPGGVSAASAAAVRSEDASARLASADTLFLASVRAGGRPDASHRGGVPGFAELRGGDLWIPDYAGNGMFTTWGNLDTEPRIGVAVPCFGRRGVGGAGLLQLRGLATLVFGDADPGDGTGGTGRWLRVRVDATRFTPDERFAGWSAADPWPQNPPLRHPEPSSA